MREKAYVIYLAAPSAYFIWNPAIMKGLMFLIAVPWVAIITLFGGTDCLHCFTCSNLTNDDDCRHVSQCADHAICFVERNSRGNATQFTSGCINTQHCPNHRPFTIIGRSVQRTCKECCSHDGCNKDLCQIKHIPATTAPKVCEDNPATNCSQLSVSVNVCSNIQEAKHLCPKYCGLCNQVDGGWSMLGNWSSCSSTCGIATKTRTRSCSNPAAQHGRADCPGVQTQIHACFDRSCPVHGGWTTWGGWEDCSSPCGPGVAKRHRTCSNPTPSIYGRVCQGDAVDFDLCTGHYCGNISTTVAPTTTTAPHCFDSLKDCSLLNQTTGICSSPQSARKLCAEFCGLCSIADGYWASWTSWGMCSTTCGNGTWTKTRTCTNPAPSKGGKPCPGSSTDTGICNLRQCPVHGSWSLWGKWSTCSASCGQGLTHRRRTCTNPRPSYNGNYCFDDPLEYAQCLVKQCPVHGGWMDWSLWSSCSVSCGTGQMTRQRYCLNPRPEHGGQNCTGNSLEHSTCQQGPCKVPTIVFNAHNLTTFSLPTRQPVVFTTIISNIGNGYSSSTGKFTAPVNGTYSFAVQLCVSNGQRAYFSLVLDDTTVTNFYDRDHDYSTTSSITVPMFLKQGQKVWVTPSYSCSGCLYEYTWCWNRFSGSLIHK